MRPRKDRTDGRWVSASSLEFEALLTRQAKARMFIDDLSTQNGHRLPVVGTAFTLNKKQMHFYGWKIFFNAASSSPPTSNISEQITASIYNLGTN